MIKREEMTLFDLLEEYDHSWKKIPAESACDRYGQCMFWKRSIESRRDEIRRLHNLIEKHINQINILEREIQREEDEEERLKKAKDGMTIQTCIVDEFLFEVKEGGGSETVCSEWRRKEGDRNELP